MKAFPKIMKARALKPFLVEVLFENNQYKIYDFSNLLKDNKFLKLSDYNFFKNFQVSSGGYGIEWDDELDLSESELWLNGLDIN